MGLEKQIAVMEKLGSMGESIPGLEVDKIVQNIIDKNEALAEQKAQLEKEREALIASGKTAEEADSEIVKLVKAIVDPYVKQVETMVKDKVNEIKLEYKKIKEGLASIPEDIQAAVANILLPPAIAAPPAAPNPVYALNLAKQSKNALTTTLNVITAALLALLKAATAILFEVPDSILAIVDIIVTISNAIKTIPV